VTEFLAMGGYGLYVWAAYGITLLVLALNLWWIGRLHRHRIELARTAVRSEQAIRRATVRQL
jgi:heme exporter protein D